VTAPTERDPTSPLSRPHASLAVLDITKQFGATTGGIKTYLVEKARYVEAHPDFRQAIVVSAAEDGITRSPGVSWYRLKGAPVPGQAPYRLLLSSRHVREIVKQERPDLIEVGSPFAVPWVANQAARREGIPMVWFYHTHLPRILRPDFKRSGILRAGLGRAAWAYVKRLSCLFERVLVTSDFVAEELREAGVRRIERVSLGVDLALFRPERRVRRGEVQRRLGLPEGAFALFAGRFARDKHLDDLLGAWPEVAGRTGAHLVLVGNGPSRSYFQRRYRGGGRVTWLPYLVDREALADLFAAADLYGAPSPSETFGLAAAEAMASGTPVLCADVGGVAERVTASGAGATFAAGDASALAAAAVLLLEGSHPALRVQARDYAERHHSWDRVFDRLFEIYRDVVTVARARAQSFERRGSHCPP
jgi:alpha-1,6-mannosyltransferase